MQAQERLDPLETTILDWPGDPGCDVHVYLAMTQFGMGAHNCLASLRRYGYAYTVLGWGEAWGGWRYRMALYKNAALAHQTDPLKFEKLVLFCDAFDVVAARPWQGLSAAYKTLCANHGGAQAQLVFGAERLCIGKSIGLVQLGLSNCGCVDDWWTASNKEKITPAVYLNNGLLMAPASAVLELYTWMLDDSRAFSDDQIGAKTFVNEHPQQATLDHTSQIFKNLQHFDTLPSENTSDKGVRGAWFFHLPGSADVPQVFPLKSAWKAHAGRLGIYTEPQTTARVANALWWVLFALLCCCLVCGGVWAGRTWPAASTIQIHETNLLQTTNTTHKI